MTENSSILIVDDEKDICDQISGLLDDYLFKSIVAHTSDDALKCIKNKKISLVILDIWLNNSKLDGFKTLEKIKEFNNLIPVIMISGHGNIETAVNSIKQGAFDFVEKPFDSEILIFKVNKAIENINLKIKLEKLTKSNLNDLFIHNSFSTNKIYNLIEKISKTESSILLTGPSGSGKEIIAKNIHNLSNRSNKSFKVISCANLSPDSFERELFGFENENGNISEGLIEKINGGSLLFDQIEDMPIQTQGKIIRFLENQKFNRIGGILTKSVNLRIMASSKVDLLKLVKLKKIREDLYFKLNALPLNVPPISERKEDIKDLCDIFINDFVIRNNLKKKIFSDECISYFQTLDFPGNVRQLKNLVEWIVIMLSDSDETEILFHKLPTDIKLLINKKLENKKDFPEDFTRYSLKDAKEIFEKNYLLSQLKKFDNNINKTANFIRMERTALYRKIKSLKIDINK